MKLTPFRIVAAATAVTAVALAAAVPAIVGGKDATPLLSGVAAVRIARPGLGVALCAGSLISARRLLAAARCVSDRATAPQPVAVPGSAVTVRISSTICAATSGVLLWARPAVVLDTDGRIAGRCW
jgi:secreted trypsin-like serine protease